MTRHRMILIIQTALAFVLTAALLLRRRRSNKVSPAKTKERI
jgi:hypothetical protein